MTDLSDLSIRELAALVCDNLRKEGLRATLSGGACAEIYSNAQYVTGDLDFIVNYIWPENDRIIDRVMTGLGFERKGRVFSNASTRYLVEFPPGPLSIGEEYRIQPIEISLKTGSLSLLSPTDSLKDRLTGYFYGNDNQCLEQAVMIYTMNDVDLGNIKKWAANEGQPDKFSTFLNRIEQL